MKTAFKINNDLLNYLLDYNHIYKLLIYVDYEHELENIQSNKFKEIKYQKYKPLKSLQQYILLLYQLYKDIPEIHFPFKLDNRGRIYPYTVYFHYQANELAKSLILFARGDIVIRSDNNVI